MALIVLVNKGLINFSWLACARICNKLTLLKKVGIKSDEEK